MANTTKKKKKVSAYHKRMGTALKKGMSFKQAHRYAKGKIKLKGAAKKAKAKAKSAGRKTKTKAKAVGRTMGKRAVKFPIFGASAIAPSILYGAYTIKRSYDQGGWTEGLRGVQNGFFASWSGVKFNSSWQPFFDPQALIVGWVPAILSGIAKYATRFFGLKGPANTPISYT